MRREFNYEPLTPTAFLHRSANVFPDRIGVVDGDIKFAYGEFLERCLRFAGALRAIGVQPGDRVALLAGNSHVMLAAHYAVPFSGGVLVALNTRITPADMAFILQHSGSSVLIYDDEFAKAATTAGAQVGKSLRLIRASGANDELEGLIADGKPLLHPVADERGMLAINYTSGTTARPKGVMYHHRGAYLQALAMAVHMGLTSDSVHLWTLPMFHCNGWCFPWAVTAAGATHVCLPKVDPAAVWQLIAAHRVTHLCGAPAVLSSMLDAPQATARRTGGALDFIIGGAAPSPSLLTAAGQADITVTQAYGLTETHGPILLCDPNPDWRSLDSAARFRMQARQGVANYIGVGARVVGPDGTDVATDGASVGELCLRGNTIMLGYLNDDDATAAAIPDGWFHTGDLAVMHPDNYVELRDRKKDVIISGGENITSIEVEQAIESHPAVVEVAVVGAPDERWGEVPVAHVGLRAGMSATEQEIIDHVRARLARFKAPKKVLFGPLPRTSTGKIQKFVLRSYHTQDDADAAPGSSSETG